LEVKETVVKTTDIHGRPIRSRQQILEEVQAELEEDRLQDEEEWDEIGEEEDYSEEDDLDPDWWREDDLDTDWYGPRLTFGVALLEGSKSPGASRATQVGWREDDLDTDWWRV
jgi:hypothetical protein